MNHDFQWKHEDLWTNTPWTLGISGDSTWILLKDYSFAMWQHQSLPWIKEGTGAKSGIPCPNVEDHQQHAHWVNMHPTDRMPFQYKKLHQKLDAWFQVGLFGKSGFVWEIYKQPMFWMFFSSNCCVSYQCSHQPILMGLIWRSRTGKKYPMVKSYTFQKYQFI